MSNRSFHFVRRLQTLPSALAGVSGSGRLLALAAALVVLGAVSSVTPVQGQTATTLVSNHSLSGNNLGLDQSNLRLTILAQAFTTGDHTNGYNLSELELYLQFGSSNTLSHLRVSIWTDSSGVPGSELVVLDNPATAPGTTDLELVSLTAPDDTVLAANTTYHVVVRNGATSGGTATALSMKVGTVDDNGEESNPAAGWSIADEHRSRSRDNASASWTAVLKSLRTRVIGSLSAVPTISSVAITSTPRTATDTYGRGETIEVTVTFTGVVTVTGTPRIQLRVGGGEEQHLKWANYAGGSGSAALRFRYVVQSGDMDDNGIYLMGDELELNGGTIMGGDVSMDANLAYMDQGTQTGQKVNGNLTPPAETVFSVKVTSTPVFATDTYGRGETIEVTVTFTGVVTVTGTPRIQLRVGGGMEQHLKWANYAGGSGSAALRFTYVVQSGDMDDNGIFLMGDELVLNGGTIKGIGDVDADLDYPNEGTQSEHKVNSSLTPPALLSATVLPNGTIIELVFDEVLNANAMVDLPLSAFSVTASGGTVTIGQLVAVLGADGKTRTVRLIELSPAIAVDRFVTVSYTDPTTGDDSTAVLEAEAGLDVVSFTTGSGGVPHVFNNGLRLPDTRPPELSGAEVYETRGERVLTLFYNEKLDSNSVPAKDAFTVTVAGDTAELTGVTVNHHISTVNIGIASQVTVDQEVRVTYTPPADNTIQDREGNAASGFTDFQANNNIIIIDSSLTVDPSVMGGPIITGARLVGSLLTVDTSGINDADGLTNPSFSYHWFRIHAGGDLYAIGKNGDEYLIRQDGDEALLGHVRGKTYRPTVYDLGSRLRVEVSFLDDRGWGEIRTSAETERITAPGDPARVFDLPSSIGSPRGIWGNDEDHLGVRGDDAAQPYALGR